MKRNLTRFNETVNFLQLQAENSPTRNQDGSCELIGIHNSHDTPQTLCTRIASLLRIQPYCIEGVHVK